MALDDAASRALGRAGLPSRRASASQFGKIAQPYGLILPSLLMAAFIVLWPLGELVQIATHDVNRFGQLREFTGLANFTMLAGDADFQATILRTLVWTVAVVGGTLVVSLPVALILNDDFYGRSLARVIVMLPWAVSLTMTAIVWRWALSGESGMLNSGLADLGLIHTNIQWLAQAETAFPVQIAIGILVSIPFTVTIFLGGLSSISDELYDAAAIEGAGRWAQFRFITLPLLKPFVNIALVLNTIYVFNSFPIIWAMTQGGPANSTDIMVTYLYKLAFRWGKLGEASAVSLLMFAVLIAFTLVYLRISQRGEVEA
jgi:multiple sugar transport system permease protein